MGPERSDEVEDVLTRERPCVRRFLSALGAEGADADDLTQETLLRAWRSFAALRSHERPAVCAWLYRIAANVMVDHARAQSRRPVPGGGIPGVERGWTGEAPAVDDDASDRLERAEMGACVNDLVDRLPHAQRAVLLLHDAHGLTNSEIAELLGCSMPAVKIRLHRARGRLLHLVAAHCAVGTDARGVVACEPNTGPSAP